ncbi:hypothetical protein JZ751_012962 [Albula glossodonta]|uniref:Uncharacterized protein n=1 Tax=Albula glossodonta TaxID=121402 RepID=A0A8T2N6D2_9TELE|nr:hypothetical protein JZ751_012962 [Albula glossodonta]
MSLFKRPAVSRPSVTDRPAGCCSNSVSPPEALEQNYSRATTTFPPTVSHMLAGLRFLLCGWQQSVSDSCPCGQG